MNRKRFDRHRARPLCSAAATETNAPTSEKSDRFPTNRLLPEPVSNGPDIKKSRRRRSSPEQCRQTRLVPRHLPPYIVAEIFAALLVFRDVVKERCDGEVCAGQGRLFRGGRRLKQFELLRLGLAFGDLSYRD